MDWVVIVVITRARKGSAGSYYIHWAAVDFIDKIVRFFIIATALWLIAVVYSRTSGDNIVKKQVKCKFCRKYISEKARRCVNCTSWTDGREDR